MDGTRGTDTQAGGLLVNSPALGSGEALSEGSESYRVGYVSLSCAHAIHVHVHTTHTHILRWRASLSGLHMDATPCPYGLVTQTCTHTTHGTHKIRVKKKKNKTKLGEARWCTAEILGEEVRRILNLGPA